MQSFKEGSYTSIYAAVSQDVKEGGSYFEDCVVKQPSKSAQDSALREKLWKLTCDQLKSKNFNLHKLK